MPRLTPIHWRKFEQFLLTVGCQFMRQEGSHRIYSKSGLARPVVLPEYRELPIFIIKNNLKILGIAVSHYQKIIRDL